MVKWRVETATECESSIYSKIQLCCECKASTPNPEQRHHKQETPRRPLLQDNSSSLSRIIAFQFALHLFFQLDFKMK
jgi:uncharacterized paraquat-inducible protein A